jgi:hypothetical protein
MSSKGRPASGPKTPITIIFATSKNSNAQTKVKTIRNRSIDDLLDCNFVIPGISAKAVIKEVLVGTKPEFINPYLKKHGLPSTSK